jgi:hypothetical protein
MKLKITYGKALFTLLSACLIIVSACQKTSELDIPSFIHIDKVRLTVNAGQGTASSKIVDAWVYTNNDLEGAFELPATFPVLKAGDMEVKILPGIKLNGMAETRAAYPFFNPITVPVSLSHEKTADILSRATTYDSRTVFAWLEDFEDPNVSIDTTSRSEIKLYRSGDDSLNYYFPGEGNSFVGKATIQKDSVLFECASHDDFVFPEYFSDLESSVFLELNYKTNCPFTVGLIVYGSQTTHKPVAVINPSGVWNKIYINFTPTVLLNTAGIKYRVYINAQKEVGGPTAEIYFDNIKLLHF